MDNYFTQKHLNLRNNSCMKWFSVFWGLVFVKNAAVRDAVWYPLLSAKWTWMDVKTLWLFSFCKEVDTVASWNFHIILWLLRFFRYLYNYNFAYKSAWWQKPMKTEIENTEPNVSSMDMAYRTTWSRVYGKMIIT